MEPVTGSLDPYEWDSEAAVAYEAAIEAINGVVGAYSAQIAAREAAPDDSRHAAELANLRSRRQACQTVRQQLDPDDKERVAQVRADYSRQLREMTAGEA
ncbi:hypothetical protein ACWC9H_27180 [Streptomyces sp. NPDC001251]